MKKQELAYFIKHMSLGHCARGPKMCEKCKEAEKNKKYYILKEDTNEEDYARPTVEIIKDGKRNFVYYKVIKGFDREKEAKEYAKKEGIKLLI